MEAPLIIQVNPAAEATRATRAISGGLSIFRQFDGTAATAPDPAAIEDAVGALSRIDFEAVEREIALALTTCPPDRQNALKRAFWGYFEPLVGAGLAGVVAEAHKRGFNDYIDTEIEGDFVAVLNDAIHKANDLLRGLGVSRYAGIAYALRGYVWIWATDNDLQRIIESRGADCPRRQKWTGSSSDAERFAKAVGMTAAQFDRAFDTGRPFRFGNEKESYKGTIPQIVSILAEFGFTQTKK